MKKILLNVLAVFLLIEEWLWDALVKLGSRLSVWLHLQRFDHWLLMASPAIAMTVFLMPVVLIAPVKLIAFWLIAHGQVIQGIVLLLATKLSATLLISHIFSLTRSKLMTFVWFAFFYTTITRWLTWAHERLKETEAYTRAIKLKKLAAAKLEEWIRGT
jgi:hypothetical protein